MGVGCLMHLPDGFWAGLLITDCKAPALPQPCPGVFLLCIPIRPLIAQTF